RSTVRCSTHRATWHGSSGCSSCCDAASATPPSGCARHGRTRRARRVSEAAAEQRGASVVTLVTLVTLVTRRAAIDDGVPRAGSGMLERTTAMTRTNATQRASLRVAAVTYDYYPFDVTSRRLCEAAVDAGNDVDMVCLRQPGEPAR